MLFRSVAVTVRHGGTTKEMQFDQVVLAGDLKASLRTLAAPTEEERDIFPRFVHSTFVTKLIETPRWPTGAFAFNVEDTLIPNPSFTVSGVRERRFLTAERNEGSAAAVAYQFRQDQNGPAVDADLDLCFTPEMRALGFEDMTVIQRSSWAYCPRFPADGVAEGLPWQIFAMQGTNNTWYAGSSAAFESINDVMKYNELLLRYYAD